MRKRWMGYTAWVMMAACLYFFENNAGTRVVLACSLLFPLIPALRAAVFAPKGTGEEGKIPKQAVRPAAREEAGEAPEEPTGDVRPYRPGDPVQRIHWKLSAKKGEWLTREMSGAQELPGQAPVYVPAPAPKKRAGFSPAGIPAVGAALCLALLLAIPEARMGVQALCNRVFAASEAANAYAYTRFPVPEGQPVTLAAGLLAAAGILLVATAVLSRSGGMIFGIAAVAAAFQAYYGLSFPAFINLPLYGLAAFGLMRRPVSGRALLSGLAVILVVSAAVFWLFPGVDPATEAASESVRDWLGQVTARLGSTAAEAPEGENETRHVHTRSLETGDGEAAAEREYRLVTVEEEPVSIPHRTDYLKAALLLLAAVALVCLPFAPFFVLNARKRKADEARKIFQDGDVGKAVCAVFQTVIAWLEATGHGSGNRLYRYWAEKLPPSLGEGYPERFAACAADFEEAAYSGHSLPEEARERALALLKETEETLWKTANRKQRFRLKYRMCLCE